MRTYIIPNDLIAALEAINNTTKKFAVPVATEDGVVIASIEDGWEEHEDFTYQNNLEQYVPPEFEIEI